MTHIWKFLPVFVLLLSGCGAGYMSGSNIERMAFTAFEPLSSNQFKFNALTYYDTTPPEVRQSKKSEQETVRIAWLDKYLSQNKMCDKGYKIDRRTSSLNIDAHFTQHQIFYYGHCVE